MSAIYIPGVEMQQEGDTFIAIFPDGSFKWMDKDFNIHRGVKKAVPVPDHGRLIDADAFGDEHRAISLIGKIGLRRFNYHVAAAAFVDDAPAVIEADKGEE